MKMYDESKTINLLRTSEPETKIGVLNDLDQKELSGAVCEFVSNLLTDEDKGVRNAATMLILNNRNPKFPALVAQFVNSQNISVRNLAGEILIKLGSLSVEPLINFNHENDNDTLKFIIDVLGLIGDERAALFIMEVISATENDNVVLACLEALGNIRFEGAVEIMILFYDRNELYKPTLVEALGKIGSKTALDFLVARFKDEDELTKYSILESLGALGDINTFFFLLEQMMEISGTLVLPLITSIFTLKQKFNLDIPFDNRMKNLLLYTIAEGKPEHKKIAFTLVDSFDDKDILSASLSLLGDDFELDEMIGSKIYRNSEFIYYEITRLINQNPHNLRNILNLFLSTIDYVKAYSLQLNVSPMDIRNIIHGVSGLLNHHDEEVRRLSMEILFELDRESSLLFVDVMAVDENNWNRLRLLEIIENIPGDAFNSVIQKLVDDENEMIRERATYIAGIKNISPQSINAN